MMETNENTRMEDARADDELLMRFFSEARCDLPDDGFTDRVMRRLPRRVRRMNQLWTTLCAAAAMVLFLLFDGVADVRILISRMLGDAAGYLSSVSLGGLPPLALLTTLVVLVVVALCNWRPSTL